VTKGHHRDIDDELLEDLLDLFARWFVLAARLPEDCLVRVRENVQLLASDKELRVIDGHTGSSWDSPWDGTAIRAELLVELAAVYAGHQIVEERLRDGPTQWDDCSGGDGPRKL